ncbi:hypothetical protein GLOIN_2v1766400 [Rhizophagus clarus]|uniref:Uncharacterized protein n=1 Tax=Rhizophagus clarus TaxID=94130 RepID=A0A8H3LJU8_9GLOM|nr:hypothetical protein GLOIN_2v1766400 [Rhizophagus clarus]
MATRKYPLTIEQANSVRPEAEEPLNREVAKLHKEKRSSTVETTASAISVGELTRLISYNEEFGDSDIDLWQVDVDEIKFNPSSTEEDIKSL